MKKFLAVVLERAMNAMAKITFSCKHMARHGTILFRAVTWLAVLSLLNCVALGQLSGSAALSGAGQFAGIGGCEMPNPCAYNGVDVIQWGTIPNFAASGSFGELNNYATGYDTSFLGHTNFDGSTFSNSAYLSPIYRVTDQAAIIGNVKQGFGAGQGGSGGRPGLTNTDTTLISISGTGGAYYICRFNPSGPNQGFCTSNSQNLPSPVAAIGGTSWYYNGSTPYPPVATGTCVVGNCTDSASVITTAQKTGGNCTSGCTAVNFAGVEFDSYDRTLLYTWGNNTDVLTQTTITPEVVNPVTGQYTVGSPIVDFQYGIPQAGVNTSEWATSTAYSYGQYVIHTLSSAEMATSGVWASGHTYVPGDIVTSQSGSFCAYKVSTASGSATSGSAPAFKTSSCATDSLTDTAGNVWKGLAASAKFVYQEVNPACTVGSPCTSAGSAFQWLATPAQLATDGAMSSSSRVLTSASNPFTAAMVGQTIQVVNAGNAGGTIPLNTTIASYQNADQVTLAAPVLKTGGISGATVSLTGHPDIISETSGDANGLVWQNDGVALPISNGIGWFDHSDMSDVDQSYPITVGSNNYGAPSKFATAISTNTYHMAKSYSGAEDYSSGGADQDTGFWAVEFDYNSGNPVYHMLNHISGIWSDWTCSLGSGHGYNCSGGTYSPTTIGTFKAISDPFGTGQPCPDTLHAARINPSGLYFQLTSTVNRIYNACTSVPNAEEWVVNPATFDQYVSLQVYESGLSHSALGLTHIFNFNNSGWGYTSGVFVGRSYLGNVSGTACSSGSPPDCPGTGNPVVGGGYPPPVTTYLAPVCGPSCPGTYAPGDQRQAQTTPPGCYITGLGASGIKSPDCNLSEALDSHISRAGHITNDTFPACGSVFNYATLSPIAFNAWQGMEVCQPTARYVPSNAPSSSAALPSTSLASPWQFTHCFTTGTSVSFGPQFCVSQFSQDGNWLFFSTDCALQCGSQSGVVPTVWSSGTYYEMLAVTGVPFPPLTTVYSISGMPWQPLTAYSVGNLINPIEGTGGGGQIDDVFQAIYVSGTSGPNSSLGSNQPKCGATSCFASTNPPLCNGLSCATNPAATPFTPGDTVCDNQSGSGDVLNPSLPYSSSCPTGIVWQDLGPGNARPEMFAVRLSH